MNLELQIQEIAGKSATFQLDQKFKDALLLSEKLRQLGLIKTNRYNIKPIDTIGREPALFRRRDLTNISRYVR